MRLVATDTEGPPTESTGPLPPRPEHRRVSASLVLTAVILAGTVATVYLVFPKRQDSIVAAAFAIHGEESEYDLVRPSPELLAAWSVPVIGKGVPWPALGADAELEGVFSRHVLRRPAAIARYRIGGRTVTVVAQRARDVPPRRAERIADGLLGISWRKKRWTFTAVGPLASAEVWSKQVGATK